METVEFLNFFLNLREKVEIVKYSNFPSEYCFAICWLKQRVEYENQKKTRVVKCFETHPKLADGNRWRNEIMKFDYPTTYRYFYSVRRWVVFGDKYAVPPRRPQLWRDGVPGPTFRFQLFHTCNIGLVGNLGTITDDYFQYAGIPYLKYFFISSPFSIFPGGLPSGSADSSLSLYIYTFSVLRFPNIAYSRGRFQLPNEIMQNRQTNWTRDVGTCGSSFRQVATDWKRRAIHTRAGLTRVELNVKFRRG